MELSGLYVYPVKSFGGLSLERSALDRRSLRWDRNWMLVDAAGRFLTQRQLPRMALIACSMGDDSLYLAASGMPELRVPLEAQAQEGLEVLVWGDLCQGHAVSPEADAWLSRFLRTDARLVQFPAAAVRRLDPEYARPEDQTGFADGFPLLLISEASLDDLNRRMGRSLPMQRFRPNLVVRGCEAYAEDRWRRIRIGTVEFRVVKPCSRCIIPTIDPATGARDGEEPLKTLRAYRRHGNKVYFGQNLIHDALGELALGARVEVLEEGEGLFEDRSR